MKTRMLLFAGLALQICFLLGLLFIAPEPQECIKVGLQRLKEEAPAQAVTVQTRTDGTMELKTAGDFFYVAGSTLRIIVYTAIGLSLLNIIIFGVVLITFKSGAKTPATG